ncbi:MAG: hypothetical protein AAGF73_11850 [Actinomycetota bacterium]
MLASTVPATVEAAMPEMPDLFDEPNTWELPPLTSTSGQSAWLQTAHDLPLCQSESEAAMCVMRSTTPILSADTVEAHPDMGYEYAVWDMSADNAQGAMSGATWDTEWQVPAGVLKQGHTYVATVSPAREAGEEQPVADDSNLVQVFHVDLTGVGTQEMFSDFGFAVAPFTGELVLSENIARSEVSLLVDVSWSSVDLSQEQIGPMASPLPAAWSIDVGLPISWYLVEAFPATGALQMWGVDGSRQRFYDNGDGTYALALDGINEEDESVTPAMTRDATYGGWRYLDNAGNEYIFDFRGQLRTFTTGFEEGYGSLSYGFEWATPDLLGSITDPVTGRSVEFHYAGVSSMCSTAPVGFDRAPLNALCAIAVNDDPGDPGATMLTTLGWSNDQLAAFLIPDGSRIDLRYDQSGNIVGLRNPVHAVPAAMGAVDNQSTDLETTFEYDEQGRVSSATYPVQEIGGDRGTVDFTFAPTESYIEISTIDSAATTWVKRTFDPRSWIVERTESSSGISSEVLFDEKDMPVGAISNGSLQTYVETEDAPAISRTTWGPAPVYMFDSDTHAPLPEYQAAMPRGIELIDSTSDANGWITTWWDDPLRDATSLAVTFEQDDAMTAAPEGLSDGWSAQFLGLVPAVDGGEYNVEVVGASMESFSVEGVDGDPTATMESDELGGKVIVEAVVTGDAPPSPAQPVSLVVTVDDGSETLTFGVDQTTAALDLTTETYDFDFLTTDGPAVERYVLYEYDDPFVGLLGSTSRYIDGVEDVSTSYTYESFSADFDELYRPLTAREGSGFEVVAEYWGGDERATPPGWSAPVLQGGLERTGIDPHPTDPQLPGRTVSRWWTAHGQSAAVHDDSTDATTTLHYDDRLRQTHVGVSAGYQPGGAGSMSPERSMNYEYLVTAEGYPATVTTSTVGGEEMTAIAISNLGGDHLLSVDYHGVQTHTTYGEDVVTRVTYVDSPLGGLIEVSSTIEVDPNSGQIIAERATTVTGEDIYAELTYHPDNPMQLVRVDYWNDLSVEFDYDDYLRQVGRTWTDAAGSTWSDEVTLTASGRMADRIQTTAGTTASYDYSFHPTGTAKQMVMTADEGVTTWNLGFDVLPDELAGSNPGAVRANTPSTIDTVWPDGSSETVTIGYDRSNAPQVVTRNGELVEVVVDRTDVVRYDDTTMLFDQTHSLISVMSEDTGRTFEYDAAGTIVSTTNISTETEVTSTNAAGGLSLIDGEVLNQTIGFTGGLVVDIDARGNHVRIGDYFDNVWAVFEPDETSLDNVEPMRYLPYGQPIPVGADGQSEPAVVNDEEEVPIEIEPGYGWLGLSAYDGPNLVTFAGARVVINEIGSFAQVDPLRVGASDYSYTNGNPFDQHDRSGNQATDHQYMALFSVIGLGTLLMSFFVPTNWVWKAVIWHLLETAIEIALVWAMLEAGYISKDQFISAVIIVSVFNVSSALVKFRTQVKAASIRAVTKVRQAWNGLDGPSSSQTVPQSGALSGSDVMTVDMNSNAGFKVRTGSGNGFEARGTTVPSQGTRLGGLPERQAIHEASPGLHRMTHDQYSRPDTTIHRGGPRSRSNSMPEAQASRLSVASNETRPRTNSELAGDYPLEGRGASHFPFNRRSIEAHNFAHRNRRNGSYGDVRTFHTDNGHITGIVRRESTPDGGSMDVLYPMYWNSLLGEWTAYL